MSFLGNSYGGVLGASYARLFPQRLRAMAVDSVPDHVDPLAKSERLQYKGLEAGFKRFVRWCAGSSDCVLRGTTIMPPRNRSSVSTRRNSSISMAAGRMSWM
nr:alpha/beta fold hydrolase [Nonomuraea mesophila]